MRLIFSKDRPAQLDLLLRSLARHLPSEETRVIWYASDDQFLTGYSQVVTDPMTNQEDFDTHLRQVLVFCNDETVTLLCDDDVVFRTPDKNPRDLLLSDDQIMAVSLRLGRGNRQQKLPRGFPKWRWRPLTHNDFGYPAAIDGHTFRVADVLRLIGNDVIPNPTMLETVMAIRARSLGRERPFMTSFEEQCLVGVPVNRVSDQSGCEHGLVWPQTTKGMNMRFLSGERIDLDYLDFSGIDSCHHEILFIWK